MFICKYKMTRTCLSEIYKMTRTCLSVYIIYKATRTCLSVNMT